MFLRTKPEAHQHVLGSILVGVPSQVLESVAQGGIGFQGCLGAGRVGHLQFQPVELHFHSPERFEGGHHFLPQGVVPFQRGPLWQVADAQVLGAVYPPAGWWFQAGQDAQQCGLACAIAPHQSNAIPMGHTARHIPKDVLWIK